MNKKSNEVDIILDEDEIPPLINRNPNQNSLKYLNNQKVPNVRSKVRKEFLLKEKFKVKGDDTNTNIFDPEIHYLDQTGNIRSRETKKVLFKQFQIERMTEGSNAIISSIEVNNSLPYSVANPVNPKATELRHSATNPVAFSKSIVKECGDNGEKIVQELCEIALNKNGVVSVRDKLEALKLLTYYFAGKPQETQVIDKNVNTHTEKKVMSFMKLIGGKQ